jgi:prevent-host-death family protein
MPTWQLQQAKNKLSQLVDEALADGPQVITRHGNEVVVVLSIERFRELLARRQKMSEFFRESPLAGVDLDLERDRSPIRDAFSA